MSIQDLFHPFYSDRIDSTFEIPMISHRTAEHRINLVHMGIIMCCNPNLTSDVDRGKILALAGI